MKSSVRVSSTGSNSRRLPAIARGPVIAALSRPSAGPHCDGGRKNSEQFTFICMITGWSDNVTVTAHFVGHHQVHLVSPLFFFTVQTIHHGISNMLKPSNEQNYLGESSPKNLSLLTKPSARLLVAVINLNTHRKSKHRGTETFEWLVNIL